MPYCVKCFLRSSSCMMNAVWEELRPTLQGVKLHCRDLLKQLCKVREERDTTIAAWVLWIFVGAFQNWNEETFPKRYGDIANKCD